MADGPLIVQSDKTLLLEVDHAQAGECRKAIAPFAELERAPEHIHTYRITRLGLWNARAAGHTAENMLATLEKYIDQAKADKRWVVFELHDVLASGGDTYAITPAFFQSVVNFVKTSGAQVTTMQQGMSQLSN